MENDDISPDILMAYCERDDEWYEYDRVWEKGLCLKCGDKSSTRIGYQITTKRTWNAKLRRPKITKRRATI